MIAPNLKVGVSKLGLVKVLHWKALYLIQRAFSFVFPESLKFITVALHFVSSDLALMSNFDLFNKNQLPTTAALLDRITPLLTRPVIKFVLVAKDIS